MCANCLTTFDVVVSQAIAVGMVLKRPVQDRLAVAGLVRPFDQLGEHANTVAFLRSLDLDPVEILGAEVVSAAATWQRATWSRRRFSLSTLLPSLSGTTLRA